MNNIVNAHFGSKIQQICCWDGGVPGLKMANFGARMPSLHQNRMKLVLGCCPGTGFTAEMVSLY